MVDSMAAWKVASLVETWAVERAVERGDLKVELKAVASAAQ